MISSSVMLMSLAFYWTQASGLRSGTPGVKVCKHILILLCTCAYGSQKIKFVVVSSAKKPKALQHITDRLLASEMAWFTSDIFKKWFECICVFSSGFQSENWGFLEKKQTQSCLKMHLPILQDIFCSPDGRIRCKFFTPQHYILPPAHGPGPNSFM